MAGNGGRLFNTTVVGSYPQPGWLIDQETFKARRVPRVRMPDVWRFSGELLKEAQDDAVLLAVRDQERAGVDVITDGEARRESYSNYFASALDGLVSDGGGSVAGDSGLTTEAPRVAGPIVRRGPVTVEDLKFLKANTDLPVKVTLPGPFTMAKQAIDDHYGDEEALVMAFADAVNAELRDLKAAGADVVQLDEPWLRRDPAAAARYGVAGIDRALAGIEGVTAVHLCFGYAHMLAGVVKPDAYKFLPELAASTVGQISIEAAQPRLDLGVLRDLSEKQVILGVLDLGDAEVETAETVAGRIRAALSFIAPRNLIPAPDCGMKYLPRATAFGKLRALAAGAALVREEMNG